MFNTNSAPLAMLIESDSLKTLLTVNFNSTHTHLPQLRRHIHVHSETDRQTNRQEME